MATLKANGIELNYEEQGSGKPSVLLIHGTGGDCSSFSAQARELACSHRVVSVDLRGHGKSARNAPGFTLSDYTRDIELFIAATRLDPVVVIGHSLGGLIALELAARGTQGVAGAMILDAPLCMPDAVKESMRPLTEALKGPAYPEMIEKIVHEFFFLPGDDSVEKKRILAELKDLRPEIFNASWQATLEYDGAQAFARAQLPIEYIHFSTPTDLDRVAGINPKVRVQAYPGKGHFAHLQAADEVTAAIQRFLGRIL